jgi:hypothetical protein
VVVAVAASVAEPVGPAAVVVERAVLAAVVLPVVVVVVPEGAVVYRFLSARTQGQASRKAETGQ